MGVEMNLRITADPEIGFFTIFIFKRYSRTAAMPTALELKKHVSFVLSLLNPFKHSIHVEFDRKTGKYKVWLDKKSNYTSQFSF